MPMRPFVLALAAGVTALAVAPSTRAQPVTIVAAESVYGDIARQIGGDHVRITSVLASPTQDPHEFEAGAATARAIARAHIIVQNGAGYDAWMTKLVGASPAPARELIDVARGAGHAADDNPHVWYDVNAVWTLARTLEHTLSRVDPAHRASYTERLAAFDASMRALSERIASMRSRHAGVAVTATEPVFGYMADALGLAMRNERFQRAVMNGTEPAAKDIAALENDLRTRAVRVLIFNDQTTDPLADRMRALARSSGVAVVGVGETLAPGTSYQRWISTQLDALDRALAAPAR